MMKLPRWHRDAPKPEPKPTGKRPLWAKPAMTAEPDLIMPDGTAFDFKTLPPGTYDAKLTKKGAAKIVKGLGKGLAELIEEGDKTPRRFRCIEDPSCGASCPVAATACRACGHAMPKRANPGARAAPGQEDRLAARVAWQAWRPGQPLPPIVGKRRCAKPEVLLQIVKLAKEGRTITEIAHSIGRKESGVRRYVNDYGVTIKAKGMSGPSFDGKLVQRIDATTKKVLNRLKRGQSTAEIAKALKLHPATVRDYSKRCREQFGVALPEFDRRSSCGRKPKPP